MLLVTEEMRRTVTFLRWKSQWWMVTERTHAVSTDVKKGSVAYANRQASQLLALSEKFEAAWSRTLSVNGLDTSWIRPMPSDAT